jgi:hypothetical protein
MLGREVYDLGGGVSGARSAQHSRGRAATQDSRITAGALAEMERPQNFGRSGPAASVKGECPQGQVRAGRPSSSSAGRCGWRDTGRGFASLMQQHVPLLRLSAEQQHLPQQVRAGESAFRDLAATRAPSE